MGPSVDFQLVINNGALIYDVRSAAEFESGHNPGSKNLPLEKVKYQITKIKKLNKPVIVCCKSGARSGQAIHRQPARGRVYYRAQRREALSGDAIDGES